MLWLPTLMPMLTGLLVQGTIDTSDSVVKLHYIEF